MASRLPVGTWILCFIVVCGVAGSAHAVDRLVPQEYPTIQEGINAAQTGDIVLVSPGVYNELIDFLGKTITVRSTDGPAVTIIDGGGNGPIVTFQNLEGPGSVLEGFTITNGVAPEGAGITILDAYPTILNNTISSNTATTGPGGGILMRNYTPNIDVSLIPQIAGNIISSNVALTSAGGGLYAYSGYDFPQLNGNTWSDNFGSTSGSALSVTSGSQFNSGIQLQGENITSGYDPNPTVTSNVTTINIEAVDLEIRDSEVQIHNSADWPGGLRTNNRLTTIEDSTFTAFGDNNNNNSEISNIYSNHLSLRNLTLINDSATFSRFYAYGPNLNSEGLRSHGVQPIFYSGYSQNSKFTVTDTVLTDTGMYLGQYGSYQNSEMIIDELLITGTLTGNQEALDIIVAGYYDESDYKVKASNIVINDLEIVDNPGQIIQVGSWSPSTVTVELENVNISGLQINDTNPVNVIEVGTTAYYYYDQFKQVSLRNILIENPTINSTPIYLELQNFYDPAYYGFSIETDFKAKNLTVTGTPAAAGAIIMEQTGGSSEAIPLELKVSHSIIEGPVPFSGNPENLTTFTFSNSLTSIPVDGENNLSGEVNFVSGDLGDYYLSQIASGDLVDSLGVNAGDPNTPVPYLGGTRADGGLDTENPDLGYHYSTRTDISRVSLELDDAGIFYEPGTGLIDSSNVSVYLREELSNGESPSEWRALSLRLLQESGPLQISSVQLSEEILESLGNSPDYFEALVCGDIITVGLIPSLSDPSITFSLHPETEIFQFEIIAGPELASSTEIIETQWIPQDGPGCGGILDVANVVTDSLGNVTPLNRQPVRLTLVPSSLFQRGDANTDGQTDLGDAVALLSFLFNGLGILSCQDSSDVNDDGMIDVADPIALLAALFTAGPPPSAPGQSCGVDPTPDTLRCDRYEVCTPSISVNTFIATPFTDGVVQLNWATSGPVDQFQVVINGVVHQRLGGSATGTEIRSLEPGLQEVCLWAITEGSIVETCTSLINSEAAIDLTCRMDPQSQDTILSWSPVQGIDQIEIYESDTLITVVSADSGLAQIYLPNDGVNTLRLVGITGEIQSGPTFCSVYTHDECSRPLSISLGTTSFEFESPIASISMNSYDQSSCRFCWDSPPYNRFTSSFGDVWLKYQAEQDGILAITGAGDKILYESSCDPANQITCGSQIVRPVVAAENYLIRTEVWNNSTLILDYISALPQPSFYVSTACSSGFDSSTGLFRISWSNNSNYFELMTVTVDGVEVGTVPSSDGTFLIPDLVSGSTYEICITGQTGSLTSPPRCQTITIP